MELRQVLIPRNWTEAPIPQHCFPPTAKCPAIILHHHQPQHKVLIMPYRCVAGTTILRRMTKNGIVGTSLLQKNCDDLWRSGYLACVLVLVAPRDSTTGSTKSALPVFAVTVLRVPRRPGDPFIRTAVSDIREYTQWRAASEIVLTPLAQNIEPLKKIVFVFWENKYYDFEGYTGLC